MEVGYAMICLVCLNISVNLMCLLVTSLIALIQFCRSRCKKQASSENYRVRPNIETTEMSSPDILHSECGFSLDESRIESEHSCDPEKSKSSASIGDFFPIRRVRLKRI